MYVYAFLCLCVRRRGGGGVVQPQRCSDIAGCVLSGPGCLRHALCVYMTCGYPGYVCASQRDSWELRSLSQTRARAEA